MKIQPLLLAILACGAATGDILADVRLPAIISNHMVLKKARQVPIWGMADPGEAVTVTLNGKRVEAQADAGGRWLAHLDLRDSPSGPFGMTIEGKNKIVISDVVVGEVWLASGQSNMQFTVQNSIDAQAEIAQSANPLLRQFLVLNKASATPMEDTQGSWVLASPETSGNFSAVGYYFAKKLQNELGIPVGFIHSSWGGTPSEAWTSAEALDGVPELKSARERLCRAFEEYGKKREAFVGGLRAWIAEHGREDKPVANTADYAAEHITTEGWFPVKLPGLVEAPALPRSGAVWLRKEVDIPDGLASIPLSLHLPIDGFDSVYWNGKLLKQTAYSDFPGTGYVRRLGPYIVAPGKFKAGKNTLAIRLYEPVEPAVFTAEPKAGSISLAGEWLAKPEFEFPPLFPQEIAAAPHAPANHPGPQFVPGFLFNGMIRPLLPYAISGVIWYQGETNVSRAWQYRTAFPLLIADWRRQWACNDLPFYFCQLANHLEKKSVPGESTWAELREAQSLALTMPHTGQAVLIDIGESGDIHPRNKRDVGNRLALIALAELHGAPFAFSGPIYRSMEVGGGKVILTFTHADGGLTAKPLPATYDVESRTKRTAPLVRNSPDSQIEGFAICGEDKKWVWADARIDGDTVVVWSDKVRAPIAVRYAWADNPTCNLYNGVGLPASPFRTDDFPASTLSVKY